MFAAGFFLLSPAPTYAVGVQIFQVQPYEQPYKGRPPAPPVAIPYGASATLAWYCKDADGTRLWKRDTWPGSYNNGSGLISYFGGEWGSYDMPALYATTTYFVGCQDNQLFGYEYAWARKTIVPQSAPPPPPPPPPPIGQPALAITGNGQQNSVSVAVGTPVTVRGTFAAAPGDTLAATALNDYANNALPGVPNNTPNSPKSYMFTPAAPGSYVFYPAARTSAYPSWSNYGKSLTVNASCPAGQQQQGGACVTPPQACTGAHQLGTEPNCTCEAGYRMQNGQCVPVPTCGANQIGTPPNCTCEAGYRMQNGTCVQQQCPGPNEVNWPACSCAAGYSRDSGTNRCIQTPTLNITVNGLVSTRVRKGNPVTLAWSASGVQSGSCSVRTNAGTTAGTGESGSRQVIIGAQTVFRLTCLNQAGTQVSKEAAVTPVPDFIES